MVQNKSLKFNWGDFDTGNRCTPLTFLFISETYGEEGLLDFLSFFGGDDLFATTGFFTSTTRVVVPTDREADGSGLLVDGAAGHCLRVTG